MVSFLRASSKPQPRRHFHDQHAATLIFCDTEADFIPNQLRLFVLHNMVNLGRSWGCRMCKKRRIKCDEGEPACKRCTKSGLTCPGYDAEKPLKIRFKDETALVTQRAGIGPPRGNSPLPVAALQGLQEDFETQAINFFVINFATAGRDKVSSRGLWESVAPTIQANSASSPVVHAATAVGGILFNVWRLHKDGPNARNPAFNRAVSGLSQRLSSGEPINGPEILLTILLLQFHENIAAVFGLRPASRMHYNGALALIRSLPIESFSTVASRSLLLNVLNIEVSLAIRECQPVCTSQSSICYCLSHRKTLIKASFLLPAPD